MQKRSRSLAGIGRVMGAICSTASKLAISQAGSSQGNCQRGIIELWIMRHRNQCAASGERLARQGIVGPFPLKNGRSRALGVTILGFIQSFLSGLVSPTLQRAWPLQYRIRGK